MWVSVQNMLIVRLDQMNGIDALLVQADDDGSGSGFVDSSLTWHSCFCV